MTQTAEQLQHQAEAATPRQRFLSFVLDWLVWVYLLAAVIYYFREEISKGKLPFEVPFSLPTLYWLALFLGLEISILLSCFGSTLGKKLAGIEIVSNDGSALNWGQGLLRYLALHLSNLPLCLGSLWMLGSNEHLTWHDRLSGSRVVVREDTLAEQARPAPPWYRTQMGIVSILLVVETLILGWRITEINLYRLFTSAYKMDNVTKALFRPEWGVLGIVLERMIETIFLALMATILAIPVASVLSFLAARNLMLPITTRFGNLLVAVFSALVGAILGVSLTQYLFAAPFCPALLQTPLAAGLLVPVGGILGLVIFSLLGARLARRTFERLGITSSRILLGVLGGLLGAGLAWLILDVVVVVFIFGSWWSQFCSFFPAVPWVVIPLGGLLGAVLSARLEPDYCFPIGQVVYYGVRSVLNVARSVEPLIWAIVFVVWVRVGPFPGMLALLIHSIAALGKLYSEQIEIIDPGPLEAITATGANAIQTIVYAVIPQIIPPYTAFTIYRWDINVRMSTVIGFVGGGGIGQSFNQYMKLLQWRKVGVVVLLIILVVMAMDFTSAKIREKII